MTHTELIKKIAKQLDLRPEEAAILWRQTGHILMHELAKGEKIRIKNFGAFLLVRHKSRTVPDPREMSKKLVIFDQSLPKFRPSEQLRARVKNVIPGHIEEVDESEPAGATESAAPLPTTQPDAPKPPKKEVKKSKATQKQEKEFQDSLPKPVNIGYIDLSTLTLDKKILELVPLHIAQKYQMVPIEKKDDKIVVAMIDPGDREAVDFIARQTGLEVEPKITTSSELQHAFDQYGEMGAEVGELTDENDATTPLAESESDENPDAPAAKIVATLLERAVRDKASDIHIEPEEKKVIVRFRIDGMLQNILELPKNMQSSVTARLKILSNLKIDESRLPQDGRLRMSIDRTEVDFRLSTLPTVNGEKIVMRILDQSSGVLSFEDLGITGENLQRITENIEKSHGMVLVTGPTGSGKSTTLYAAIGKLMSPNVNIVTLEDPVEYRMMGINQSQVNGEIGYDFASGLRSIVRQDPDIILIGEIRDLETATMAIHSALTGHVVLSTLHTNDAAGAVPRLIDMGIEPFLITSSTNAVVAQRLVRKLCEHCKEKVPLDLTVYPEVATEIEKLSANNKPKDKDLAMYKPKGCDHCNKSGYKGRVGIYEVLPITETIKQLALKRVSNSELAAQAVKEGMVTLKQDGVLKAIAGMTSLEEVWRVTRD